MKRFTLRLFVMMVCLLGGFSGYGQTIILGTGTAVSGTSTASPINVFYESLHGQILYTAAEINAQGISCAGTITHFGFYISGSPDVPLPNYTIKMKHTTATDVATYDGVGLTTVHSIASYIPPSGNWDLLQLNTPFAWNGVDNILVDVCFNLTGDWSSTGQVRIYSPAVPNGFNYSRSDGSNQCGVATSNPSSNKPQAQLTFASGAPLDLGVTAILDPVVNGCYSSTQKVRVRVKAYGTAPVDFSVNNLTINSSVSGINPATFTPLVISSGTLPAGGTLDTTITATYDMSAAGTYTFNAKTVVAGDGCAMNDSVAPLTINYDPATAAGTASVNNTAICGGNNIALTLTGSTGSIQWQSSTDGGTTWVNEAGAGFNSTSYTTVPAVTTMYRAEVCGTFTSNELNVDVTVVAPPAVTADTRCGIGPVDLSATGSPTIQWYNSNFGGSPLFTGGTYSPTVTGTTTFYAQANDGVSSNLGRTNNASGSGALNNLYGLVFDATVGFTLNSVKIYPVGTGNITIGLLNSSNNSINSRTIMVSGATGQPINAYLGFSILPGTGYKLVLSSSAGVTALYFDGSGNSFPYTVAGTASITSGWNGTSTSTTYYYFYDWNILTGCSSARTPVTATVTPADTVLITSSSTAVCSGQSVTMVLGSNDPDYEYSWSPASGLNTTAGDTVVALPTVATTYTVTATNTTSGCQTASTKYLQLGTTPSVSATSTPAVICVGDEAQLDAGNSGLSGFKILGTGTSSTTSYPNPYGNFYEGARNQMLVTASELTALGLSAGSVISSLGFDVASSYSGDPLVGFTIKMGHTTLNSMTTFATGLTTVKTPATHTPVLGWNQHTFTTNFVWDGTSNVIVETCFNNTDWASSANLRYTTTSFTSGVYYRADALGVCTNNTVSGTSSDRPNMRFMASKDASFQWSPVFSLSGSTIRNPLASPVTTTDYIVVATNPDDGCVARDTITVNVNQLPVIGLANTQGFCQGDTLQLDAGTGFTSYNWSTTETTQTIGVTSAGSYSVSVVDVNGCTNSDTIALNYHPAPTVSVGPDVAQCGGTVTLTSTASPNVNYLWSNGAFTTSLTVTESDTLTLTVTNAFGCSATDTIAVLISDIPALTLGSDTSFCPGGSVQLTANAPTGTDFVWSTSETTPSITVNTTGTYEVTVTNIFGCVNSDTITIGLSPVPVANAGSDLAICSGEGTVLTASGGNFYTWSTGANTPSVFVTPGVTTSYVVLVENAYGCADLDTVTVSVNSSPIASAGTNQNICEGASATLTASGGTNFNWSTGETTPTITVNPTITTTYNVVVSDANNCTSSASVTVTVNNIPTVSAGSDRMICEGSSATLTASGGTTYNWSPAIGLSSTTVSNPVASPSVTTTYTVSVSSAAGCSSTDQVVVSISPLPVASFTSSVNEATATFASTSANTNNYSWDFGDASTASTSANPTHQYLNNGTYVVIMTAINGCGSDTASTSITINGIGIAENVLDANTMIYPNPTKGVFTLSMSDEKSGTVTLRLLDINGQLIDDATFSNFGTELRKDYDISNLAKGVYYLHIVKDNTAIMKRIILN